MYMLEKLKKELDIEENTDDEVILAFGVAATSLSALFASSVAASKILKTKSLGGALISLAIGLKTTDILFDRADKYVARHIMRNKDKYPHFVIKTSTRKEK